MRIRERCPCVEDAYVLSVADLLAAHRRGARSVASNALQPAAGQQVAFKLRLGATEGVVDLTYAVVVDGMLTRESDAVRLEATHPHYGGTRWWFRCRFTGRRASQLHLFPGQRRFCHRTGIEPNPTYLSQRVSGMDKIYRRLYALRQSLPGQGSILETLKRPRGMHLTTYLRLLQRDEDIWNSPQNRLLRYLRNCALDAQSSTDLTNDLDKSNNL
jgi:hypothetical protein